MLPTDEEELGRASHTVKYCVYTDNELSAVYPGDSVYTVGLPSVNGP